MVQELYMDIIPSDPDREHKILIFSNNKNDETQFGDVNFYVILKMQ